MILLFLALLFCAALLSMPQCRRVWPACRVAVVFCAGPCLYSLMGTLFQALRMEPLQPGVWGGAYAAAVAVWAIFRVCPPSKDKARDGEEAKKEKEGP